MLEELIRSAVDQKILDRAPRLEDVFTADTRDVVAWPMRIAIAADHNGVVLKARLIEVLRAGGHDVDDRGRRALTRSSITRHCARTSPAAWSTAAPTARSSSAAADRAR